MNYYRCNVLDQSLLSLPTWKTISGDIATFDTSYTNPLRSCVAQIVAQQAGSGDASPSNVRTITGFSSVVIANKDDLTTPTTTDTHTITLPETIYGGNIDVISGSGSKTWGVKIFDGTESLGSAGSGDTLYYFYILGENVATGLDTLISHYKVEAVTSSTTNTNCGYCYNSGGTQGRFAFRPDLSTYPDITSIQTYFAQQYANGIPVTVIYKIQTPTSISTTPETISTLSGTNNIYADTGNISVTAEMTLQEYINQQ